MNYPQSGLKTMPASKRDSAFNQTWGGGGRCDTNGEALLQDVSGVQHHGQRTALKCHQTVVLLAKAQHFLQNQTLLAVAEVMGQL